MPNSEFSLIDGLNAAQKIVRNDVHLGIGDDCALLTPRPKEQLAVSMDTLVSGVHFLPDCDPVALGHKALAVNLSDIAAMGAEPAWATLSLTLPKADSVWIESFMSGFYSLAEAHTVQLVGGDTCSGPLSITVQAHGFVPAALSLRRKGAKAGHLIYVTGTPGDAALGLASRKNSRTLPKNHQRYLHERLECPTPRVAQGLALRGIASACIDISDGLVQDLTHIAESSGCGAQVQTGKLPLSDALIASTDQAERLQFALAGGDDYELCFTVAPEHEAKLVHITESWQCLATRIGIMCAERGIICCDESGHTITTTSAGYDHFA